MPLIERGGGDLADGFTGGRCGASEKKHPCGSDQWRIMRRGMDFRIRCQGCDHEIWLPRPKFEKMIKKVIYQAPREPRT